MNDYPDPKVFPDEQSHLLFDIGYGYALMFRARELFEKIEEELLPEQEPLWMEVREMLEAIRDFNKGRVQSIDQVYATIGKALELARAIGSASIHVKPPPE